MKPVTLGKSLQIVENKQDVQRSKKKKKTCLLLTVVRASFELNVVFDFYFSH